VINEKSSIIILPKSEKERNDWIDSFNREISAARLTYSLEKILMNEAFQVSISLYIPFFFFDLLVCIFATSPNLIVWLTIFFYFFFF